LKERERFLGLTRYYFTPHIAIFKYFKGLKNVNKNPEVLTFGVFKKVFIF